MMVGDGTGWEGGGGDGPKRRCLTRPQGKDAHLQPRGVSAIASSWREDFTIGNATFMQSFGFTIQRIKTQNSNSLSFQSLLLLFITQLCHPLELCQSRRMSSYTML